MCGEVKDDVSFLRNAMQEELHLLMTQLRGEIRQELRVMHQRELSNLSLLQAKRRPKTERSERSERSEPTLSSTASAPPSQALGSSPSAACREAVQVSSDPMMMPRSATVCLPSQRMLKLVSHELKAPLNGLAGYTRTLAETDSKHQKEFKLLSNTAQFALDNVTNLTDLWTYANSEVGALQADPVNLEELNAVTQERINKSVNRKGKPILQPGVTLNFTVEDSSDAVKGDFNALSLLEYHLVANSAKFTEKGQVDVSWHSASSSGAARGLCLTVRDTGIGCEAPAEQLFEAFVVEDSSESRKREGIGLGLAVVREIARVHDAKVFVESSKGVGSTFRVMFPATLTTKCSRSSRRPRGTFRGPG